jgi:hypothetical protein
MGLPQTENIEQMVKDLKRGGWEMVHHWLWRSPEGHLYLGPHKAWHIWAGTPMCSLDDRRSK